MAKLARNHYSSRKLTKICITWISIIIIWQDSLQVNPSVLIGSFLVGILPYGPFPWKRSYAVYFFGFRKPRRQIQTTKRKRSNTLIFAKKLPKRLIYFTELTIRTRNKYSRSEFYYPEDLMQRLTQASANVNTILQRSKKVQTQIRRWQLIWTLFSTHCKVMVWQMKE